MARATADTHSDLDRLATINRLSTAGNPRGDSPEVRLAEQERALGLTPDFGSDAEGRDRRLARLRRAMGLG